MNKKELFKNLKKEMLQCEEFTSDDVYNSLKGLFFIEDEKNIKKYCEFGIMNYDYIYYKRLIQEFNGNNILDDILKLIRNEANDIKYFAQIINENYCDISDSFRHYAENLLICDYKVPEQGNLKMQYIFNLINIVVEIYIKPQILLHYNIFCNQERNKSLGEMVVELLRFSSLYKFILNEYLYGININQWRNIAEHKSYRMDKNGDINVNFNNGNEKKVINLKILEEIITRINIIGYLFRLIFDVVCIDYNNLLDEKIIKFHREIVPTDSFEGREILLQEISKNYDIEVLKSEYKRGICFIFLKSFGELQKQDIFDYVKKVAAIIPSDNVKIMIENIKKKITYTVTINHRNVEIFKWKA